MSMNCTQINKSKLVAVVVPLSNRSVLTEEEKISFKHLTHYLGKYDRYLIAPPGLSVDFHGFGIKRFDGKFFGSATAHSRLLLSPIFYKSFLNYKFILIYHLDSLVFSDELAKWCEMDFDFIGPPWIKHDDSPYRGNLGYEGKVGNGGFSLRKVESFLKVIYSPISAIDPFNLGPSSAGHENKGFEIAKSFKRVLKRLKIFNSARWEMYRYAKNEEHFWANRAKHYYPEFKIAPVEMALSFGFECVPRYCFEQNDFSLPFGCHAWFKYDREFWEPYLLK
jgi:hypothetical protein